MIDTLGIAGTWRLHPSLAKKFPLVRYPIAFGPLKLWRSLSEPAIAKAEVSLAALLFGHNGRPLANQAELSEAIAKLHAELSERAEVGGPETWTVRRVDLAWNFDCKALPLTTAHATLRHPLVQKKPNTFNGIEMVSWRASRSRFEVRLYDKAAQMRVPGSVLRAEISMMGAMGLRHLRGQDWRDFAAMYQVYREILSMFPEVYPSRARGWPEAVGQEPPEIRHRILARMSYRSARTRREDFRRIETEAAGLKEPFAWSKILPMDGPPPPAIVEPRKRRR